MIRGTPQRISLALLCVKRPRTDFSSFQKVPLRASFYHLSSKHITERKDLVMPNRPSSTPEESPAMSKPPAEGCQAPNEDPNIITVSRRPSERSQIALHPSHVLRQLAASMNGHSDLPFVILPHSTKWGSAISAMQTSICGKENELLLLNKPVPKETKQRLRQIALQFAGGPSNQNIPFRIWTNVNLSNLPEPRKPFAAVMSILKESAKKVSDADLYEINVLAIVENSHLPSIAGRLKISALDGSDEHPQDSVESSMCLWDTGLHCSSIFEDLLSSSFREFLNHPVHDPYRRSGSRNIVQVDALFGFSNQAVEISTIFLVLSLSHIPNRRSGIILGQQAFIEMMVVRCVPRYILIAKGEQVADNEWGDIAVEEYVNSLGELTQA